MSRNAVIEGAFLTTDDAIQGLWALHTFVRAAVAVAPREQIRNRLPQKAYQMTHEWVRFYQLDDLVKEMDLVFEFIHSRNSLVLLVSMFEGALRRFNEELHRLSYAKDLEKYKKLLEWFFDLLRNTQSGSATMQKRLPRTCGDVDDARRLRNCFAHNNGRYEQFYLDDAIRDGWVQIQHCLFPDMSTIPLGQKVFLPNGAFENLLRSHLEVLHITYNTIQRTYFGETQDYNYEVEGKQIEWHRILSGQTFLGM